MSSTNTNLHIDLTAKERARGPQPGFQPPDPKRIKVISDLTPPASEHGGRTPQPEYPIKEVKDCKEDKDLEENSANGLPLNGQAIAQSAVERASIINPVTTSGSSEEENRTITTTSELRPRDRIVENETAEGADPMSPSQLARHIPLNKIVNPGHGPEYDPISFPEHIAGKLFDSQIEGIQFLWREVVQKGEGALLAHTMGMGKTLQVITILYLISQAGKSTNTRVMEQVPDHLRGSLHVLIVAPPGLLLNWREEFMKWVPKSGDQQLLNFYMPSQLKDPRPRVRMFREWEEKGGVLLIGYQMLRDSASESSVRNSLVRERKKRKKKPKTRRTTKTSAKARGKKPVESSEDDSSDEAEEIDLALTPEEEEAMTQATELRRIVLEIPNIVVADEAHAVKNEKSGISEALGQIATNSRIALTGSPLANNLSEYYCLTKWVAEDMLGPKGKFKAFFSSPIEAGLYEESSPDQRRIALRRLAVGFSLALLNPVRHRLPEKTEFLITVELTEIQRKIYSLFAQNVVQENIISSSSNKTPEKLEIKGFFDHVRCLRTLLNHPKILLEVFKDRAEKKAKKEKLALNWTTRLSRSTIHEIGEEDLLGDAHLKTLLNLYKYAQTFENFDSPVNSNRMTCLFNIIQVAEDIHEKILIFSSSIPTLNYIGTQLNSKSIKYYRIDGVTKPIDRHKSIAEFDSENGANIMIISTRAGGVGLNITAASRVVIFDFDFSPQDEEQAIARAYRLGQTKPVFVYRFKVGGTFEDVIHNRSLFKISLAARVVDHSHPVRLAKQGRAREYFRPPGACEKGDLLQFLQNYSDPILLGLIETGLVQRIDLQDSYLDRTDQGLTKSEQKMFQLDLEIYYDDYEDREVEETDDDEPEGPGEGA
ncbi:hypothetical protein TWF679_002076 [Orbilia oligospora]|uniref:Uncharacterized protein n=1 Tax=Orbilia oligospora TaxID=2813651 RepID=A0A8H8UU84_ORBOL|nr:hypothetical protein TWF679_002076 [Orbilia oligospora]